MKSVILALGMIVSANCFAVGQVQGNFCVVNGQSIGKCGESAQGGGVVLCGGTCGSVAISGFQCGICNNGSIVGDLGSSKKFQLQKKK